MRKINDPRAVGPSTVEGGVERAEKHDWRREADLTEMRWAQGLRKQARAFAARQRRKPEVRRF